MFAYFFANETLFIDFFESFESFYSKTKPLAGVQVKNIQTYKQQNHFEESYIIIVFEDTTDSIILWNDL